MRWQFWSDLHTEFGPALAPDGGIGYLPQADQGRPPAAPPGLPPVGRPLRRPEVAAAEEVPHEWFAVQRP